MKRSLTGRLISLWTRWIRSKQPLDSPARFRKVLCREQACADLNGQPLSVLTFAARDDESAEATFQELEKILKRRLRCTDAIGWFDRERMAAALPSTPREGAVQVADDICMRFSIQLFPPFCEIYCYPADRLPGEALLEDGETRKESAAAGDHERQLLVGQAAEQ